MTDAANATSWRRDRIDTFQQLAQRLFADAAHYTAESRYSIAETRARIAITALQRIRTLAEELETSRH